MDPEATIQLAETCINDGRHAEAVEAVANYYQWRLKGGAQPEPIGDARVARLVTRLVDAMYGDDEEGDAAEAAAEYRATGGDAFPKS